MLKLRVAISAGCALFAAGAMAQQRDTSEQTATRRLWDADFLSHRPPGAKNAAPAASSDDAYVGITLWRLRPGNTKDAWIPERIPVGTPLVEGEKIRISIETSRAGYLYVIYRGVAEYQTKSAPFLIFPEFGSKNRVPAGTVVTLPSPADKYSYIELKREQRYQVYQMYTILTSPEPIPGMRAGPGRTSLKKEQVADWESKWRAPVRRLGQPWLAGEAATPAETNPVNGALTQDDPLPQDLYHSNAGPGDPLLVDVLVDVLSGPQPEPLTSIFGRFGVGGLHTTARPSPKRMTAGSFLIPLQDEAPGYGLYSYVLFGSRPESLGSDRWRRYREAILAFLTIPSASEMSKYSPIVDLNVTYLPIACSARELPRDSLQPRSFSFDKDRLTAHAMEHQADGKSFSGHTLSNMTTACTLVSNYDYPRAQKLLSILPDAHLEGPYIISVMEPLSKTQKLPAEYLYQDLSSVPPDLINLWIREFMAQAQQEQFWKRRTQEQLVLQLRTAIGIVSQQMPDFSKTITWAFVTAAPTK